MGILFSLLIVVGLAVVALVGASMGHGMQMFFGVIVPYVSLAIFIVAGINKVVKWGRTPVPFQIPTTCGQQKSLPWIKHSPIENPNDTWGVVRRMALEVLLFRSLFRNLKTEINDGKLSYGSEKLLWLAGLAFHVSFFTVVLRHLRFFITPVPAFINITDSLDGFMQVGAPHLLLTGVILVAATAFLLYRRIGMAQIKHISLPADYFPLFLIIGIALSGIVMRYVTKVDIVKVKELTMGLLSFSFTVPSGIGVVFFIHVFLISTLLAYFPFSKLMHLGGVFLSPTRNMPNNSREKRHINPWNDTFGTEVHTYAHYEDAFREKMKDAGLPVEKE
ncbi:MAG: sulfate reduction electron transfer complex DsrMKJOP subunit DsrM [Nitrospira sp.]|nr:sulfate reduction electron transfer complex DsrMKJOP subunit DsrM [bacterium]MBL7050245.1 sulfate reduction electron transfer complex DsrMKJOP subunit DsrM [Nitrospira sp.]